MVNQDQEGLSGGGLFGFRVWDLWARDAKVGVQPQADSGGRWRGDGRMNKISIEE